MGLGYGWPATCPTCTSQSCLLHFNSHGELMISDRTDEDGRFRGAGFDGPTVDVELRLECAKVAAEFFHDLADGVTIEQACNFVYDWVKGDAK